MKDKPFGTGTETVVVLEETTLMNFNAAGTAEFTPAASLEEGKTYTVIWNGTKYSCVAFYLKSWGGCCIGNRSKIGFTDNTGEPFAIITGNSTSAVVAGKDCTTATVSITTEKEIIHTIDPKYLVSYDGVFLCTTIPQYATMNEVQIQEIAPIEDLKAKFANGEELNFLLVNEFSYGGTYKARYRSVYCQYYSDKQYFNIGFVTQNAPQDSAGATTHLRITFGEIPDGNGAVIFSVSYGG